MHPPDHAPVTAHAPALTPAAYARARGLCKSTVYRQIAEKKIPVRPDGLVDVAAADEARRSNPVAAKRWDWESRKKSARRPGAAGVAVPAAKAEIADAIEGSPLMRILNMLTSPAEQQRFAAMALRITANAEMSYLLTQWFTEQIGCNAIFETLNEDELSTGYSVTDLSSILGRLDVPTLDRFYEELAPPELIP